ncbi:MAG: hypothetical protein WBN48_18600 [Thiogranum sp.]
MLPRRGVVWIKRNSHDHPPLRSMHQEGHTLQEQGYGLTTSTRTAASTWLACGTTTSISDRLLLWLDRRVTRLAINETRPRSGGVFYLLLACLPA